MSFTRNTVFFIFLALHGAAGAVVMVKSTQVGPAGAKSGIVDAVTPGESIRINGHDYAFSVWTAKVHDLTGAVIDKAPPKGARVGFTVRADGARERVTEVWIAK